ncbi:MAG: signal peptidase II [Anaerolineae bacterium]|nr:MAG: signal peptidase II [Anaerolineae bacterium]
MTLMLVALDQLTKIWAIQTLQGQPGIVVIPNVWDLVYVENPYTAFGLTRFIPEPIRIPFVVTVATLTVVILTWYVIKARARPLTLVAVSLIAAGAVGNLIDRFTRGVVVDFIYWHAGSRFSWPVFNLADSVVTVGVILLLLDAWFDRDEVRVESPNSV